VHHRCKISLKYDFELQLYRRFIVKNVQKNKETLKNAKSDNNKNVFASMN